MDETETRDLSGSGSRKPGDDYQPFYEHSYAILVGINRYHDPDLHPLGNAENDARAMRDILVEKPYEFEVELLLGEQATRKAINDALARIYEVSRPDDRVIFYFAGHGYIHKNRGYLACYDTNPRSPFDGLEYDDITKLREFAGAKHIAFIFDACFSGKLFGLENRGIDLKENIQVYLQHKAYQGLTAGAVEPVPDYHSMTGRLVEVFREGIPGKKAPLTFNSIAQYIQETIHQESNGYQTPEYGMLLGSSKGQMVFLPPGKMGLLPDDLSQGLSDENPRVRRFAIDTAEKYLSDPEMSERVRSVLEQMQVDDDDREVRERITKALRNHPAMEVQKPDDLPVDQLDSSLQSVLKSFYYDEDERKSSRTRIFTDFPDDQIVKRLEEEANKSPEPVSILQLLPPPFVWCEIPERKVSLEESAGTYQIEAFKIAKYPVTNSQFNAFIIATNGYNRTKWWEGLAGGKSFSKSQNRRWKLPNHPCENVSWFEALAFCRWVSYHVGYEVRLATEWEWQWAAQGADGLEYPWGNEFDKTLANTREGGGRGFLGLRKGTTPVDQYPKGESPFGVADLAGNVMEWCMNDYDNPANTSTSDLSRRAVRGGSWNHTHNFARTTHRYRLDPGTQNRHTGFRIASPST